MSRRFHDLAFTAGVRAEQERAGSRAGYARRQMGPPSEPDTLGEAEAAFLAARDSFYVASVSETGWPYVQHRGGPVGFVRALDEHSLGWADFSGNRQYITAGNAVADDRVALIFMDYPNRRRLKVLGHLTLRPAAAAPEHAVLLAVPDYRAAVERVAVVAVEGFDWNCPQHITPRYTMDDIERAVAPLRARIAELERARSPA